MKRSNEPSEQNVQNIQNVKVKSVKSPKRNLCKRINYYVFAVAMSVLIIVVMALGITGAVGLGYANSIRGNLQVHRYCVLMLNTQVFDSPPGDTNGWGNGFVEFDLNANMLHYNYLLADLGTIDAIHIHGPVTGTDPFTAAIFLPSDGSSLSTTLTNNQITGSLKLTEAQGNQVVNNPTNYYILIKTDAFPGGAIGSRFTAQCNPYRL